MQRGTGLDRENQPSLIELALCRPRGSYRQDQKEITEAMDAFNRGAWS